MNCLEGMVAMVTGAGRGIGRTIALAMAKEGAAVAVLYGQSDAAAQAVVAEIESMGGKAHAFRCDVSQFEQAKAAVRDVIAHFGDLHILVNNAGIVRDAFVMMMRPEQFREVIDTNLTGAFHMTQQAAAHFMRKRQGRIINISSVIGIMGNVGQSNYAAAKAGLIGMTKSVARELAGRNVTCNAIAPGFIESDMTRALSEEVRTSILQKVPMGKMGTAEDVADMAVFLASKRASYITGEVIKIDGGLCM